jgi:hypothetical protein
MAKLLDPFRFLVICLAGRSSQRHLQAIDYLQLALVHPPGDGDHHEPERIQDSGHIVRPLSRASMRRDEPAPFQADPVSGPYGIPLLAPFVYVPM